MTSIADQVFQVPVEYDHEVTIDVTDTEKLTYTIHYVVNRKQLAAGIAWATRTKAFGLDFETSGLDPIKDKIATIQFGSPFTNPPEAFVVDIRCFTDEELAPLYDVLFGHETRKLGQNIRFECKFALGNLGRNVWNVKDTQVTEMILRAGLLPTGGDRNNRAAYGATSMDNLCRRHLGIKIDKDKELRMSFYSTPPGQHNLRQQVYAAGDVIYVFYIDREQQKEVLSRDLVDVLKVEHALNPILALTEHTGMGIDETAWRKLWQEAVVGRTKAESALHKLLRNVGQQELLPIPSEEYKMLFPRTGKAINFDSPAQVKYAIKTYCESIKWPVELVLENPHLVRVKKQYGQEWFEWRSKNKKNLTWDEVPDYVVPEKGYCVLVSTGAEELRLARLRKQLPRDIVDHLLEYAKYSIRESTFGNEFLTKHVKNGRFHMELHQAITSTGRLSASPNSMNIPRDKRYRAAFIPRKGYKFAIADYSQIEPRLSAQESQDLVYLQTFLDDDDIYLRVAEAMLGKRPDVTTPEGALERQIFKTIVLAMAYRMGPPKLYRRLLLALEDDILAGKMPAPTFEYVRGLHKKFLDTFENLHQFQNLCSTLADPKAANPRILWDKYLQAPVTWATALCGRKRFFPMDATNTYTEASNSPIQGCSATITKAAIVLIQQQIRKHGFDAVLVNIIHDELVYEVAEDIAAEFAALMQEYMEKAGQYYLADVKVKAEFPEGSNGVVDCWTKKVADAAHTV